MAQSGKGQSGAGIAAVPAGAANTPQEAGKIARSLRLSIAIMDPVTWFLPMWAFLCGAAASGHLGEWPGAFLRTLAGMMMVGPVLLGFAQIINNSHDREVDALKEPNRPIPAGKISSTQIIMTGTVLLALGIVLAFLLGSMVAILMGVSVLLGISYRVHPLRFKRNGWLGNGTVSFAYEGLPWLAGTAALSGGQLHPISVILAVVFSIGAHGIMTVNDFNSIEGDRTSGIRTLPVMLGERNAAVYCCTIMNIAQVVVVVLAITQGHPRVGGLLLLLLLAQWPLQGRWIAQPQAKAPWYHGTGILLYVVGMLIAAFGVAAPAAFH